MIETSCPNCGAKVSGPDLASLPNYPFCSDRCRMADLDRWFSEEYTVSGKPDDEGNEPYGAE